MEINPEERLNKLQVMTISTCTANCVFCPYVESWHKDNPGKMEQKLYLKILNDMEDFEKFTTFCPYLMNEPLSDNRIYDWIGKFYDKYPDKMVEFSINPSLLNVKKTVEKIYTTFVGRPHTILLSFHGMNEGSLEYIMNLDFKSSVAGTLKLLKKVEDGLNITIRGSGTSIDGVDWYFSAGHLAGFWRPVLEEAKIEPESIRLDFFRFHDRAGNLRRDDRNAKSISRFGKVRDLKPEDNFYCIRFDQVLHVLWNGDLAACCMDYRHEIDLGNLSNQTIKEYYTSEKFLKFIGTATGVINSPDSFICKRCISPGG